MKPALCPVCGGSGKYFKPQDGTTTTAPVSETCHGCGGKGWVEVNESMPYVMTYPVYPTYPYGGPYWPLSYPVITYTSWGCDSAGRTTSGGQ